ncbi:MAG: lipoprotein signal peptidase [Epsilonproteobacteria bacterium]|nr:lipoprotein signal peptidase [Campylobacterota bacterium]
MTKNISAFILLAIGIFLIDQNLKALFLDGFRWNGEYISLILVFNKGVAFSMFSFLQEYLKYIQTAIFVFMSVYLVYEKKIFLKYSLPLGVLYGAGIGNLHDRFVHGGVVDYIFWHKWFNFAVFNFADIMIDFAVVWILFLNFRKKSNV